MRKCSKLYFGLILTWIRRKVSIFDILPLTTMFYNDFVKVRYAFNSELSNSSLLTEEIVPQNITRTGSHYLKNNTMSAT